MLRTLLIVSLLYITGPAFGQEGLKPIDAEMRNVEYPYPVSYLTFNIQNQSLKMAYMDVRPQRGNGKTILLLHGKNFNGAYWQTTAAALSDAGYRAVIPDQIGFGKSSKPAHFQYSFHLLAQLTKNLLDTLQVSSTAVLGHSMEGMLATRFALMYPSIAEKLIFRKSDWFGRLENQNSLPVR